MAKTLIIPDLHNDHKWVDAVVTSEAPDVTVFLGDYFDDFNDGPNDVYLTALWLKDQLDDPKKIFLLGNHDQHYAVSNRKLRCSGWSEGKAQVLQQVLLEEDWKKLRCAHVVRTTGFPPALLSHAGLHPHLFSLADYPLETIAQNLQKEYEDLWEGEVSRAFQAGVDRGGKCYTGGFTWLDWSNLPVTPGLNQIVGHTPLKREPSLRSHPGGGGGSVLNLDCAPRYGGTSLHYYGLIEDGIITYKGV